MIANSIQEDSIQTNKAANHSNESTLISDNARSTSSKNEPTIVKMQDGKNFFISFSIKYNYNK